MTLLGRKSPALPSGNGWQLSVRATRVLRQSLNDERACAWVGHGLHIISSAAPMEYHGLVVPTNHVSVSVDGHRVAERRPTDAEMAIVRRDFDMEDAEEDNHSPGVARHLFLPLHLPRGTTGLCECKSGETVVVEPDGYRWSKEVRA